MTPVFNKKVVNKSLITFYNTIDELMRTLSTNQKKKLYELLPNLVLVGSTVIRDKKNWDNDDDIDFYYYEPNSELRNRNFKCLDKIIPKKYEEACNLDLLPYISTNGFNNGPINLTDYVFGHEKEFFTEQVGLLRAINYHGFLITKLAALSTRQEPRDFMAIQLIYELLDELPDKVEDTITNFGLIPCVKKYEQWIN